MAAINVQPQKEALVGPASDSNKLERDWKFGLIECCDSGNDLLFSFCFPHCYSYCTSYIAGQGVFCNLFNCFCFPFGLCCLRIYVRDLKEIEGGCCEDICTSFCCPCCTR